MRKIGPRGRLACYYGEFTGYVRFAVGLAPCRIGYLYLFRGFCLYACRRRGPEKAPFSAKNQDNTIEESSKVPHLRQFAPGRIVT